MAIFSNQASLSHGDTVSRSNVVTGEIAAPIFAEKTAMRKTYRAGDRIAYSLRIVNTGNCDLAGISVSDTLGGYTLQNTDCAPLSYVEDSLRCYLNGTLGQTPEVQVGGTLWIRDVSVPAGSTTELRYEAAVTAAAPLTAGSTITNTAVISAEGIETITVSETIAAEETATLILSKSLCPAAVTENGTLTYTFVIQNIGNCAAVEENTYITDTFDPILKNITVLYNGTRWTHGEQYTYNEQNGMFATCEGQITVPAATYSQTVSTGAFVMTPGVATIQVTGTV